MQDCKTEHWCNALFVAQVCLLQSIVLKRFQYSNVKALFCITKVDIGGWIPTWLGMQTRKRHFPLTVINVCGVFFFFLQ